MLSPRVYARLCTQSRRIFVCSSRVPRAEAHHRRCIHPSPKLIAVPVCPSLYLVWLTASLRGGSNPRFPDSFSSRGNIRGRGYHPLTSPATFSITEINHHRGFMVFLIEYTGLCGPQRESRWAPDRRLPFKTYMEIHERSNASYFYINIRACIWIVSFFLSFSFFSPSFFAELGIRGRKWIQLFVPRGHTRSLCNRNVR